MAEAERLLGASYNPSKVLLFCGKRKSGKDFVTENLSSLLKSKCPSFDPVLIHICAPVKKFLAAKLDMNYEKLLDSSEYKEKIRPQLIEFSELMRKSDDAYFIRQALKDSRAERHSLWIVCDCRHRGDFDVFESCFPGKCLRIRVEAEIPVRESRGFAFREGIDDNDSECGLDDPEGGFHFVIRNDGLLPADELLNDLISHVKN